MIDIIIASYNEPKATLRAVNTFLKQKIKQKFRIIVVDPFLEVGEFLKNNIKDKRFHFFLDPGEGKNYALSILFQEYSSDNKDDIFILTDGDVYVSNNAVEEILNAFKDPKVGCVSGRPIPVEDRSTKYGYWPHILFDGVDKVRKELSSKENFFETTGYLQAIRKGVIFECPEGTSDDVIIPYLLWKKGYKLKYLPDAKVYVQNPSNWKDWVNQKIRNIKAHERIEKVNLDLPRMKTFSNEITKGTFFAFSYPKNLKEFFWTIELFIARLYIYLKAFKEIKQKKHYRDGWREVEINSTKPFD